MSDPHNLENDDAQRFLAVLAGTGIITFQTFDDTGAKQARLSKVLHGTLNKHVSQLHTLNAGGAGVFVMVNQGDGRGRRTEHVNSVRALFVDLDGAPLEPVLGAPIEPHIVVETSPGRWHAYWLVEDFPLTQFTHFQSQLAKMFGADQKVKDLPRVMRIPGFLHNKNGAHRSKLISICEGGRIALDTFAEAFDINPNLVEGERNTALFNAASGFKRSGIPKAAAHLYIKKINAKSCDTPLEKAEVHTVVENAYDYEVAGFSMIRHAIVDTAEFDGLSGGAAKLLFYAMRRRDRPEKIFALPYSEFKHIRDLKNRQSFRAAIEELMQAGLLIMTSKYIASVASADRRPSFYRIADRVHFVP